MLEKFRHITTFVFDVDGVLTDGTVLVLPGGLMARGMNIRDGYALQLAVKKGYRVLVISGGNSAEVKERLAKLGVVHTWMQVNDKAATLQEFMNKEGINTAEVLYMGDDIPDLTVMKHAGLPCCPQDAAQEIKEIALYISHLPGGKGCARDVIEKVMKLRGDWSEDTTVKSQ